MKIEIGKSYEVGPKYKKSFEQCEFWRNDENKKTIGVRVLWRSGSVIITPQNEDEVQDLKDILEQKEGEYFEPDGFEECEFAECWDGVSEDLEFYGDNPDEEKIQEKYEEGEDFVSEILEEFGYESDEIETFIWNEVEIEEAKDHIPF
jgi:hypothetical protein